MKPLLIVLAVAWSVTVHAQTFVNYKVTSFPNTAPGVFTGTTNFTIPTNVLARIVGIQGSAAVNDWNVAIVQPGMPTITATAADNIGGNPLLGPATVTLNFIANNGSGQGALALVQFDTVNGSASPLNTVIQPANMTATVSLQVSTNLTTWQTLTNASFGKTNVARFFRTTLTTP